MHNTSFLSIIFQLNFFSNSSNQNFNVHLNFSHEFQVKMEVFNEPKLTKLDLKRMITSRPPRTTRQAPTNLCCRLANLRFILMSSFHNTVFAKYLTSYEFPSSNVRFSTTFNLLKFHKKMIVYDIKFFSYYFDEIKIFKENRWVNEYLYLRVTEGKNYNLI